MVKSKISKGVLSFILLVVFVYVGGGAQVDAYGMESIEQSQENLEPSDIKTRSDHGAVIAEGVFGSSPWILFENGTLEIGAGTLGVGQFNVPTSQWSVVSRVIFTGEVKANANSSRLFRDYTNLKAIENSHYLDTSSVTNMSFMFYASSLNELDVSNWDTSSVTNMSYMFDRASSLNELDVSNWNTSSVTNMSFMFSGASSLNELDVSKWDTSSVTNMSRMFSSASSLNELDVSNWNTSSVTNMSLMFSGASSLNELDVSNWDTSSVTNMSWMFSSASSLNELDVSNWDTSSVTDMSVMFNGATSLNELDVTNWDTSSVTAMVWMFGGASNLNELDVSNWDTSSVTNMYAMFEGARSLSRLVLGERSLFQSNTLLPGVVVNDEFTGRWIGENTQNVFQRLLSEYNGDFPDAYVWERRDSEVIVKYVTVAGEELAPPTVLSGKVGLPFETEPKDIDGWFVIETPANASGVFSREAQEVVYVYERTDDPEIKLTFLDFFPDENLAQVIANRFARQVTDEVTEEELNHLTGTIGATYRNISNLEGVQHLTHITHLYLDGNKLVNESLEPLSQLMNLRMLFLNDNQITDLSLFSDSLNPILTISAKDQKITLDSINVGEATEGIFIRTRYGQVPPNMTFTPIGGSYQIENGMITWVGVGKHTLTWSDDNNFSGTITQYVAGKTEFTFLDFFPDENLALAVANRFGRAITDEVTKEELNSLTGRISGMYSNISDLEGVQHLTGISVINLDGNELPNESLEPLSQLPNLEMLFLDDNQITDLSLFSDSLNPLLTITAKGQKITLDSINQGEVTEGISIRTRYGQIPPNMTFTPNGGSYQIENGTITWVGVGEHTLIWSDDNNFSGTITQVVNP